MINKVKSTPGVLVSVVCDRGVSFGTAWELLTSEIVATEPLGSVILNNKTVFQTVRECQNGNLGNYGCDYFAWNRC